MIKENVSNETSGNNCTLRIDFAQQMGFVLISTSLELWVVKDG